MHTSFWQSSVLTNCKHTVFVTSITLFSGCQIYKDTTSINLLCCYLPFDRLTASNSWWRRIWFCRTDKALPHTTLKQPLDCGMGLNKTAFENFRLLPTRTYQGTFFIIPSRQWCSFLAYQIGIWMKLPFLLTLCLKYYIVMVLFFLT